GRRFDWQAKEWWAPRADATAAYVQGVLERFPELDVAPDVAEWLARAVKGWVGRVSAARRDGAGWFVCDGIAGELPEELPAEENGHTIPLYPYLLEPLEFFIRQYAIDVAPNALVALDTLRIEHDGAIGAVQRSRAADGATLDCEPRLGGELRPFQRAGVRYALESRRLFIADEQGLGKTIEALALLEEDDAFPAVVICPASLKLNWQREIEHWLPHRSVEVVSGTSGALPQADIVVLNYEIVHAHRERLIAARP